MVLAGGGKYCWWNGAGRGREVLLVEWCWQGEGSTVTVPLYLPKISHGQTWDRRGERPATNSLSQNHPVLVIQTSQLMLYREIIAVCSEIHTKHINTLCGQNVELLTVKLVVHIVTTGGTYSDHWRYI
jgi:hypothetical protein